MKVWLLATNNCMVSSVYGVLDVFFTANYCLKKRYGTESIDKFDCQIVTIDNKVVKGYSGIDIKPTHLLSSGEVPDIIIVSSTVELVVNCCAESVEFEQGDEIVNWLLSCQAKGSLLTSYCTGAFLLALAGVLAGKVATTHWRCAELFRRRFPFVKLDCSEIIIDNGDVICSGGSMSYIDLAIYLIESHVSKELAADCAKLLVFDPVRQKQSPYISFKMQKDHNDQAILKAQEWLEGHFKNKISLDALATHVGLGTRTFKRRFKRATSENPVNYLQRIRVEQVKSRLENTTEAINQIIWSVGYEDISSFRQLFKRFTGLTPKNYRLKFSK